MNSSAPVDSSGASANDVEFAASAMGIMWPNTAAFAGALWHFTGEAANVSGSNVDAAYYAHADRLRERGITNACPVGCACNVTARCGKPYFAQ